MKIELMNPETHLTLHEDGNFTLIHKGMPLSAPTSKAMAMETAKRYKLKIEHTWNAATLQWEESK